MGASVSELRWSLPLRIAFRFIFVYLVLYLPTVFFNTLPIFELELDPYSKLWDPVILWVGQHVFGVEITVRQNGSGDTTWNYVEVFTFAVLATALTAIWSILDRNRPHYRRLHAWLRVAIRFALSMTMIIYGAVKVIQSQFPPPSLNQMVRSYGDSSPMGLLWTFMGFSEGYNFFAGAGELLGGLLLITRRTTLVGALVTLGVAAHVAVLNLCYDVPVKLLSLHLVALTLLLILPDARRLLAFFVLERTVPPADHPRLFRRRWANIAGGVLGPVLLGGFFVWSLKQAHDSQKRFSQREHSSLYGIWNVEEFTVSGTNGLPAKMTDDSRWRRLIFDNPRFIAVYLMNDARLMYRLQLDETANSFELSIGPPEQPKRFAFKYERPEPDLLKIDGSLPGQAIHATLRRTQKEFLLTNRGFRWINEFPMNR